jgi:hypothetical protein
MYRLDKINKNIQDLNEKIDSVRRYVLKPYREEILTLPKNIQKEEWRKYFLVDQLIDDTIEVINLMNDELDLRPTKENFDFSQKTIRHLRNYIKTLGGNPSIINHTLDIDLT